jgi:hypothetical protein
MRRELIVAASLFVASSSAIARGGAGDGGGFIALALAGLVGWIASRVVGAFFGFLIGVAVFFISAVFMKYVAAALGVLLIVWFLHSLLFKRGD